MKLLPDKQQRAINFRRSILIHDPSCVGSWWSCLYCDRYFTKYPDVLFCPDCRSNVPR